MAVPCKWSDIVEWIERSESLFIKKLSRNDCSWADDPDKLAIYTREIGKVITEGDVMDMDEMHNIYKVRAYII